MLDLIVRKGVLALIIQFGKGLVTYAPDCPCPEPSACDWKTYAFLSNGNKTYVIPSLKGATLKAAFSDGQRLSVATSPPEYVWTKATGTIVFANDVENGTPLTLDYTKE